MSARVHGTLATGCRSAVSSAAYTIRARSLPRAPGPGPRRRGRARRRGARTRAVGPPAGGRPGRSGRTCPSGSAPRRAVAEAATPRPPLRGFRCPCPEPRPPAPHRQQRDVQRRQLLHRFVDVGVAREVHAHAALDHEAQRRDPWREQAAPRAMVCRGRGDPHAPQGGRLPLPQLDDMLEAAVAQQVTGPDGATIAGVPASAANEDMSRWSRWTCEIRTASILPTSPGTGTRRLRCPSRERSSGSVSRRAPPSSTSTVA